jgi:lipopolysaccharide transport system permease protein
MNAGVPIRDRAAPPWRVIRPSGRWSPRLDLGELWRYRGLAWTLALRDLKLRYRQALFGVAWAVIQPALAMLLFSILLGDLAGVPSDGLPYPVFVIAGLAPWFFISGAVSSCAESLVEHRELVTKVWFPRLLAPIAAVTAGTVDLLIGFALAIGVTLAWGVAIPLQVLTLPVWLAAAAMVALGAGLWVAAANVLYRDLRYALGFLLQLWLFASPVVFPSSLIEGGWSYVFALNPVAGVIDGTRWALLDGPGPGPELAVSAASLLLLLAAGLVYFRSAERLFADRI